MGNAGNNATNTKQTVLIQYPLHTGTVSVATSSDQYQTQYRLSQQGQCLQVELDLAEGVWDYIFNVDGQWMIDENAKNIVRGEGGMSHVICVGESLRDWDGILALVSRGEDGAAMKIVVGVWEDFLVGYEGLTDLVYYAARYGCHRCLMFLIEKDVDVDVNCLSASGSYPIHGACWGGFPECVRLLLRKNVRLDVANDMGELPIDNAQGNDAIITMLNDYTHFYSNIESRELSQQSHHRFSEIPVFTITQNPTREITVVCISDTHLRKQNAQKLPPGDIIIHSGDFTNRGTLEEVTLFSEWFCSLNFQYKILISGNHERGFTNLTRDEIANYFPGCIYLQDELVEIEGIRIYGTSWMNWGPFSATEESLYWHYQNIPKDLHILITHNPPFNVLDKAWENNLNDPRECIYCGDIHRSKKHWGSLELLNRVLKVQPLVHQFGHVHDDPGWCKIDSCDTLFINAAQDLQPTPIVMKFNVQ